MKAFLKTIVMILLISVIFSSCSQINKNEKTDTENTLADEAESNNSSESVEEVDIYEPFIPVIRFVVCSDIHIKKQESVEMERLSKLFETAYSYCDNHATYNHLDAFVVCGDLTDSGHRNEFTNFNSVLSESKRDDTIMIAMLGNHEFFNGNLAPYKFCIDQEFNKHVVINGFHFISISPDETSNDFSSGLIDWLNAELAIAAEDDPDKPIFTFQHPHLQDTVYVSSSWHTGSSEALHAAYSAYPQIINFSGHSHGPINNPRSIWQDDFTMLGTGTLSYFEMEYGASYGSIPPGNENAAQYYIVEVNDENIVKIMPYNILTNDFMKTPSNTDDPDKQLVYYIPTLKNPEDFQFTRERYKTADEPYFSSDSILSISDISANSAKLTIPQALDENCIYSYVINYSGSDGSNGELVIFSEYYFEPLPDSVSYVIDGLSSDMDYNISVTPVNVFDVSGSPITISFKTLS